MKALVLAAGPIGLLAGVALGLLLTRSGGVTPVAEWAEHASTRFDAGTSSADYDAVKQLFRFCVVVLWKVAYVPWLYAGWIVVLIGWAIAGLVCLPFASATDLKEHLREDSAKVAGFSLAWSLAWTAGFGTLDWGTIQAMKDAVY